LTFQISKISTNFEEITCGGLGVLSINLAIEKKISGALAYMEGAARIWAMHIFSSNDFGEMIFFYSVRTKLSESDPLS
jgi:hypothetical protein